MSATTPKFETEIARTRHALQERAFDATGVELEQLRDDYADAIAAYLPGFDGCDLAEYIGGCLEEGYVPEASEVLSVVDPLRREIDDALERTGRTRTGLAGDLEELGVCNAQTVLRFLRGDQDAGAPIVSVILLALGLDVQPRA